MLIHSVMPTDALIDCSQSVEKETIRVKDGFLEGTTENGVFTISSLFSTNPAAYLNKQYLPGQPYYKKS